VLSVLLSSTFLSSVLAADEHQIHVVPALAKPIALDGNLKKLTPSTEIKARGKSGSRSGFSARLAYWKDTLILGIDISDDHVLPGETLSVAMHFPGAGATARGYTYRFAPDGKRAPDSESGPPAFANNGVQATAHRVEHGWTLEAALPAKSFPRFPAKAPLSFELCVTYEDRDEVSGPTTAISNCEGGSMHGLVLSLPNAFRRGLKINPPDDVVALEGREHGWVGYALLHYPIWITADRPLTAELLRSFFLEELREPAQARIFVPPRMQLPDGRPIATVLTGRDPFDPDGRCNPESELRIGLYVLQGVTARRALEWPAASCALGQASSVILDEDGALSIGYESGTTANFIWSSDHFERTEIG
jgi:hypothetical protein